MSKPFSKPEENFTMIHNDIFDILMNKCSPNAFKILMAIFRKTRGWNKNKDNISYSQLRELTGIVSNSTIQKAIQELESSRMIMITKGNGIAADTYCLNVDYDTVTETVTQSVTETVNTKDIIKDNLKKKDSESTDSLDWDILAKEAEEKSRKYIDRLKNNNPNLFSAEEKLMGARDNINDYPIDVQNTIKAFCKRWRMPPPPKSSKSYSKWIKDSRELMKMSNNVRFSVDDILDETYYIWKTPPSNTDIPRGLFEGRFTVKDIGSINNMAWVAASNLLNGETKRKTKTYYDAEGKEIRVDG